MQVRPASYNAAGVVGFLRVLLRKIAGKIVVIWDGSPIHRGYEIKALLKRGPRDTQRGLSKRAEMRKVCFGGEWVICVILRAC